MKTAGSTQQGPVVPLANALILYRPQPNRTSGQFSYTPEAFRILTPKHLPSHDGLTHDGMTPSPDLAARCARWVQLLDNQEPASSRADGDEELSSGGLDLYHSGRRRTSWWGGFCQMVRPTAGEDRHTGIVIICLSWNGGRSASRSWVVCFGSGVWVLGSKRWCDCSEKIKAIRRLPQPLTWAFIRSRSTWNRSCES